MFPDNLNYTSNSVHQSLLENIRNDDRIQDISRHFMSLSEPHKRVLYVYGLLKIYQLIPLVIKEDKCEFSSCHYRNLGNKMYEKKKLYMALQYYNLALMYAPLVSPSYALAISNRSAVLAGLKQYDACLNDINMVLSMSPMAIRDKLLKRRSMCMEALRTIEEPDIFEKNQLIEEIFAMNGPKNSKYVDASSKLAVLHTPELGRHVVAQEDIEVGDVIVREDPFVSVLLREQITMTCGNCFSRHFNMYPCAYCCMTMYCSRKCVGEAWESYHFYECPFLASLLDKKFTKLELLALRTTIKARTAHKSWEDVFKAVATVEDCKNIDDLGCYKTERGKMVYGSKNYESMHSLSTNLEKRDASDLFQKTVTAAILLRYLGMKNFLSSDDPELKRKIKKFTTETLMHHLMTAPTNMHSITANVEDEDGNFVDEYNIGSGAYPFLSLINHSCAPNVVRYTRLGGTQTTLVALRPIKKGMQILDNYG